MGGGGGGKGVQFSKRLDLGGVNFENAQNVGGVEIVRHRAGHVTVVKLYYGSLPTIKCYPYKDWSRNLSAKSSTRNVACM